jgi:hypothetical protein
MSGTGLVPDTCRTPGALAQPRCQALARSRKLARAMEVRLEPEQPPAVKAAVAALLGASDRAPDPWWLAGLREALEPVTGTKPDPFSNT